jgi:hypothetical protein
MMNIYDLPIEPNETVKDKTKAFIHENKIVCHPDLVGKVKEGMGIMKASTARFEQSVMELARKLEDENEQKNEQKKDITTDSSTNAGGH